MNKTTHEKLSPQGIARRDAMLSELLGQVDATRSRRRFVRRTAQAGGCVVVLAISVLIAVQSVSDGPRRSIVEQTEKVSSQPISYAKLIQVKTDSSVIDRFRATPDRRIVFLDDDALLDTLDSINRPAKFFRDGDKLRLNPPVTDRERGIHQ